MTYGPHAESSRIATVATPAAPAAGAPSAPAFACRLSGVIVGTLAGAVLGTLANGAIDDEKTYLATAFGGFLGLVFGRKIAAFDHVLSGAAFGAFLPFALCVLHAIRSGRIGTFFSDIATDPKSPLVLGGMLLGGALVGGLLVGLRELIARATRPATSRARP